MEVLMMRLITEISHDIKVIGEGKTPEFDYIEGVFSTAEAMNNNQRKYRKSTLEREVSTIMEKVQNKCLWGELGHPPGPEINPERICILTESLEWKDDNNLYGRAKIINTPMGQIARTLIKEGKLGISSRGLGTVSETDHYVADDYCLITWDLVTDPSNSPSWVNGILEGKDFADPRRKKEPIVEVVQPKPEDLLSVAKEEYHKKLWQILVDIEKSK
jgi:hypothetical protein